MQDNEKLRYHRVERSDDDYHLEDETSHLWAVSYADFLMVLLSFFILFFSVDNQDKNSIIRSILETTSTKEKGKGSYEGSSKVLGPDNPYISNYSQGNKRYTGSYNSNRKMASLSDLQNTIFKKYQYEYIDKQKKLILRLPDDVYKKGSINLNEKVKEQLSSTLSKLIPFSEQLKITFVGHTDSVPIVKNRKVIVDNYDLSVLRATRVLQLAIKQGLSPNNLLAKGAAENERNSRSLSIEIVEILN
ncbi:MAG: OmpA family protein [Bdellovibrionales bacterium]|nr:OmpA family protein [Bdellovibrionales bacterium]